MHSPANGNCNAQPHPMTPTTIIDAGDRDSGKAPSWSARRRRAPGNQQADFKWRRSMEPPGTSSAERLSSFRPTHRRSKSLANMEEFLIYNNNGNEHHKHDDVKLERVQPDGTATSTPCDKTSIEKLISGTDKDENITRDAQEGGGHYLFGRSDKASDDVTNRRHQAARQQTTHTSRLKLTQLRSLLAKPFSSLTTTSCLLLLLAILSSCPSNQIGCSLVINVNEHRGGGDDDSVAAATAHSAHSHALNRPSRYVIVSNATSARSKRASASGDSHNKQQKLERSAKLLEADALNYLQRYGYMTNQGGGQSSGAINLISEDSFQEAVMQFQRFAGIPETGSVDSLTVRYMQMPRCGNKDMSGKGENGKRRRRRRKRRRKRYALQGSKWRRQELTYRISQYPTRFLNKKHEVDSQIERAFKIWSQVAPIDFVVKKEGRVHIDIRFANGEHGDGDPFDGPGNTLAHAYFPQYGGDAHFDDQEYWTVDSYAGTNIFQVAAHELGHSLGLGHSSVREALMAPFYQKFKPNFKLHADDVLAIQALYGERNGGGGSGSRGADDDDDDDNDRRSNTPTTSSTTESSVPRRRPPVDEADFGSPSKPVDLCQDSKIDAITRTEDGNTYVFRGHHYWQIKNEGLASGSPGKIARDWDGLPGNLDAALTWSDGKTFFFKGDKYWRYFNKRREPGYPKLISVGFAGIPNNIQTAFVWSGNGKTYFFKGDKYWRFDSKQEPPVSGQYPKPVKNWVGLPASNIDAAFKWENGMTYFFKDDLYYRFDDREFEVDTSARPAFPRSTSEWWFGCTNSNLPIRRAPASDDMETSQSQAPEPTLLLFHRRPNTSGPDSSSGTSLTRSIFSSLSALFPSSSSAASNDNQHANSSEWSFHRGLGEEVRRLTKPDRGGGGGGETSDAGRATSRWFFPLGSSQSGGAGNNRNFGEQSLSELRMMTNSSSS